jgi:Ser/Thr protein kinase RdoA (MazF antagonist)
MVQSELDFVTYLAEHGVNAARPAGPVETVGDFAAAVFEQVPGVNPFSAVDMWQVCREIGRLTGRMHRLARQYRPSPGVQPRFAWHENDYLRDLDRYVPSEQVGVRRTFRRLMEQLHALPKDADSYGLIHGDVVVGNYLWHAGQLHIFDFDEAHYGWFASDVAIPLFYAIPFPSEDREEMATGFLREFFAGYNQEFRLDPFWLKQLPLFLRLRQMILYTTLYRNGDLEKLSPWGQRFMAFARTNLETDEPFMAFDFGRETPVL